MLKQRRYKKRKNLLSSDEEIDPMVYAVNMIDCMLVLAVGFLIFTIMSMSAVSSDTHESPIMKQVVDLNQGQELNTTPQTSSSSTTGLTALGTVYKDPQTGKLIMIQQNESG